jgi:DNA-binding beta-propeller fold protein YncE
MKLSWMGRIAMATLASVALGLGMTACGGGTIGYMWVLGDQFNQITGYKIDDFTGNLTQILGSPFTSNGVNPVSIVVKPGGRYVYVVNQGTGGSAASPGTSSGVAVYSVGGDGVLTFQQTYPLQGNVPVWAQFDGTGSFLYVLTQFSGQQLASGQFDPDGAITAFSVDASTGRLILQTNCQIKNPDGTCTLSFRVGLTPTMLKTAGGCLYTLDAGDNAVFPYAFGTAGQLTLTTPGSIPISATNLTSINGNGSNIYITAGGTTNLILPFTVGSGCNLTSLAGGTTPNLPGTSNPMYSLLDNSGKYLYVLNQSTTSTQIQTPFSSISAFVLNPSTSQLAGIASSPYKVGSNPVCMVEDPSNQYVYVSNRNDGTVTGLEINSTTGELSDLTRGSTFPASGLGSCLAESGAVN